MYYRVLSPEEATPLLLDPMLSPVVACDTEFYVDDEPWPGRLRGVSMAGGTPETGFFGCFWSFEQPYQRATYQQFHERVLRPIVGDPNRIFVCHPLTIEMPQFRRRGLTDEMTKCKLEDTIAQAYIYDDNLPHALKSLAYCVLLKHGATTYSQTNKEIDGIRAMGGKVSKGIVDDIWNCYKEERKKSTDVEAEIDPSWPSWKQLAMSLPPGMVRNTPKTWSCSGKQGCGANNPVDADGLGLGVDNISAQAPCLSCGRKRKLTHGVEQHVRPIVVPVVQRDYDQRAQDRFEVYGAEDAIYTLMLRYQFQPSFTALQLEHLELETRITHPICTRMMERGLKIDIPLLESIHWGMGIALEALREDVVTRWSLPTDEAPFNPASNDQLARRLWVDWGLNPPKWAKERGGGIRQKYQRAKDGLCKADSLILETMAKDPAYKGKPEGIAITRLLELRRWEKLFNTYIDEILILARRDPDGRIHSTMWPTGARSGRFSSSSPNVENIPRPFTMPTLPIEWAVLIFGPCGYTDPNSPPRCFVLTDKHGAPIREGEVATHWRVESLREIIIAPEGCVFVSADLSQIENRLTGYESRDATLLNLYRQWDCFECKSTGECNTILHACPVCGTSDKNGKRDKKHPDQPVVKGFVHGKDIHSATAASLGYFEKYGADDGRQQAKPVNHASTYGMGPATFAKRNDVPIKQAEEDMELWHATYPGVKGNLHARASQEAFDHGVAHMFDGHVRRFHAQRILRRSGNFKPYEWEATIREYVNVLAQGGTGVIMKRAMITIDEEIHRRALTDKRWRGVYLVNQVHDELLYECPESLGEELLALVNHVLENSAPELDVPVLSEGGTGATWGQAH